MSGNRPDLYSWRNRLLRSIKRDIREILGPRPSHIQKYYLTYRRVFRNRRYQRITSEDVIRKTLLHNLVYLGDFHTLSKSQAGHLQILNFLVDNGKSPVVIMEMFASEDQEILDRCLSGEIDESQLMQEIRYRQSWGFSWNNYRGILRFLKNNGLKLFGMNVKQNLSLEKRDHHFSKIISGVMERFPDDPIVVIVGDMHLAPPHLPAHVDQVSPDRPDPLIIYQNSETIYMHEMQKSPTTPLDAVKLSPTQYCLFNTPPWVKMESYLMWLQNSEELLQREMDAGKAGEELLDYDSQVEVLAKNLSKFFNLPAVSTEEITLAVMDDYDFLVPLLSVVGAHSFFMLVQNHQSFYVPGAEILYLPSLDLNRAAAEITHAILCRYYGFSQTHPFESGYFLRRVLYFAVGYFAIRIVNPLYPLETRTQLQQKLKAPGDRKSYQKLTSLRKGLKLAQLYWTFLESSRTRPPYNSLEAGWRDQEVCFRASITLGKWVALKMLEAYEGDRLAADAIIRRFPAPSDRESDALAGIRFFLDL